RVVPSKEPLEAAILHQGVPLEPEAETYGAFATHPWLATDIRLSEVGQKCPPKNLPKLPPEIEPRSLGDPSAAVAVFRERALCEHGAREHGARLHAALEGQEAPHGFFGGGQGGDAPLLGGQLRRLHLFAQVLEGARPSPLEPLPFDRVAVRAALPQSAGADPEEEGGGLQADLSAPHRRLEG